MNLPAALDHGAPPLPATLPPGREVIAAAGVWGDYGSVIVLRRDDEEDNDLLDDVYLLARSPDGRWPEPSGLITLPGVIRSVSDVAWFRGFDASRTLRGTRSYLPLTDSDRRDGWPSGSFWAELDDR
ncbi:hypothetical protein ACQP2X_41795 [Actinoplanes sp. CA-131856]